MPRPGAVIHPGPGDGIVGPRSGVIPIHRGAAIHQDDVCVAPAIAAIIDGPRRGEACLALVPSFIPVPRDCIVRPRTGISFLTRLFDNDP